MFGFFKKKRPTSDPPTEKQKRYAARLGIQDPLSMSKTELSAAITKAERQKPALAKKRERIKEKVREHKYGKELIELERQWNRFADEIGFMLAIYSQGKETIVDVLRVNAAFITKSGKLRLGVEAPRLKHDKVLGDILEWEKSFELPADSILYKKPLSPHFSFDWIDSIWKSGKRRIEDRKEVAPSIKERKGRGDILLFASASILQQDRVAKKAECSLFRFRCDGSLRDPPPLKVSYQGHENSS